MLHEAGHLVVAKACGMKVSQYFVGFGPRLWSVTKGETEYGLRAIPAGGFVKIPGMSNLEEIDEVDEPRTYRQASFPRKLAVACAGSAVHFVLALAILWSLFSFVGMPSSNRVSVASFVALPGGVDPARTAGLEVGDVIVSADGRRITSFDQLTAVIEAKPGKAVPVVVDRSGRRVRLSVVPRLDDGVGRIGIAMTSPDVTVNPAVAMGESFGWTGDYVSTTFGSIGSYFADAYRALTNPSLPASSATNEERPMSIVGAARIAAQAAQSGLRDVLLIFVMLNIFIGIFNMLPVPVLDGGHVAIALYERLRTRRGRPAYHADYAKLMPVVYATVMILVMLGGSLVYLDIVKPIPSPFQ